MSTILPHRDVSYNITYHIVFVTKYRAKCINTEVSDTIHDHILQLCNNWKIELITFGGGADHVHMEIASHPNVNMSVLINNFKTITSRYVRRDHTTHLNSFLKQGLWSRAYYISSVGISDNAIRQYITDNHHSF